MTAYVVQSTDIISQLIQEACPDWCWDAVFEMEAKEWLSRMWQGTFKEVDGHLMVSVVTKDKAQEIVDNYNQDKIFGRTKWTE